LESEYTEQVCSGEWAPGEHVAPHGCGARRRILKEVYSPGTLGLDSSGRNEARELLDPGSARKK